MNPFTVDADLCRKDGICAKVCPIQIIDAKVGELPTMAAHKARVCIGCGQCMAFCPANACSAPGLSSRESLDEYGRRPEFHDCVKRAKLRVELEYERSLNNKNPSGAIFALKNFGWRDNQDLKVSGRATIRTLAELITSDDE